MAAKFAICCKIRTEAYAGYNKFINLLFKFLGFEDFKSLNRCEQKLLKGLSQPDVQSSAQEVTIGKGRLKIWTVSVKSKNSNEIPLVLLHSLGYGASFWSLNLPDMSSARPVYAIDMLGFGKSSRMPFSKCRTNIELEFAKFFEAWRVEMKLDKFILLGHGFGAYVAFLYVSRYPERVRHVIFVEPWGFEVDSKQYKKFGLSYSAPKFPLSTTIKMTAFFIQFLNQYSILRFVGPGWGVDIIKRLRSDLLEKFSCIVDKETIAQYIYYWNGICTPTGETAFFHLSNRSGSARHPIFFRINSLSRTLPMTFIFGSRSNYIRENLGYRIKVLREGSYVDIQVVNGAGHYLFIEKHQLFNDLVNLICFRVDHNLDRLEVMERDILRSKSDFQRKRSDSSPSILEYEHDCSISANSPSRTFLEITRPKSTERPRRHERSKSAQKLRGFLKRNSTQLPSTKEESSDDDSADDKHEKSPLFIFGDENAEADDF